jgi:hypothetical protein
VLSVFFCFKKLGGEPMERTTGEVLTTAERIEVEFLRIYEDIDAANAPDKRKADIVDSIWGDIYNILFKPGINDIRLNNCKSKLKTYDAEEVREVTEMYIRLCKRYGGVIKYNQFCNLTGINRYTIDLWHKVNNSESLYVNLSNNDIQEEYNNIYIINNGNNNIEYYNNKSALNIKYNGNGINANNDVLSSIRFDVKKKLQMEMQDSNTNALSNDTMGQVVRANNEEELGKLYEPKRMLQQVAMRQSIGADGLRELGQSKPPNFVQIEQKQDPTEQ